VGALKKKKRDNADKKSRRKYKELDEAKNDDDDDAEPTAKRGKPLIITVRADKEQKPQNKNVTTNTETNIKP
jgi:hypothetical protein